MQAMGLPSPMEIQVADEAQMQELGRLLAGLLPYRPKIWLHGDLGAGKSTLARACLRTLGVQGAIKSPTYTLVERYPLQDGGEAWHLDLYRIADAEELEYLGLDEADVRFWLIEWPQRGQGFLSAPDLELELLHTGETSRIVKFTVRNSEFVTSVTSIVKEFH